MGTNDVSVTEPVSIKESAKRFGLRYVPAANIDPSDYLPSYEPNTNGCTPLLGLIANGYDFPTVQQHILAKPEQVHQISNQKWTPLHMLCVCAYSNDRYGDIMCALIEAGANINAQDADGFTPLMRVLVNRNCSIILFNILMDRHCDLNLKNSQGYTALHLYYQARSRHINQQVTRPIFDAGFSINNTTDEGDNLLMVMIRDRDYLITRAMIQGTTELIDRGIDLDAVDSEGNTSLHIAARNNFDDIAQVLIDKGSNVNAFNNDGETPITLCHWSDLTMIRALRNAGATDRSPRCCACTLI